MAARFWSQVFRRDKGHKLTVIFAATVLLPGLLLGVFGLRALLQEKDRIDAELRRNLQATAERIERRFESEAAGWRQTLDELDPEAAPSAWPQRLRAALDEPGSLVALVRQGRRISVIPAQQVLFRFSANPPSHLVDEEETPAAGMESIEFQTKNYGAAIEMYRALLRSPAATALPPGSRAVVLHRLARTLKKAGQPVEALKTFQMLGREPETLLGPLPSGLVAAYEGLMLQSRAAACPQCPGGALRLFESLAGGRWQLEKESYAFYSERLRGMIPADASLARLLEVEQRKLALSRAVESYLDAPRSIVHLDDTFWLVYSRRNHQRALILSGRYLASQVWPAVFGEAGGNAGYALLTPDRKVLYGRPPGETGAPLIKAQLGDDPRMLLEVWPANTAAVYASLKRQQSFYAGALGFLVLLLAFGGYLSVQTVRAEVRMAKMKEDFVATVSHEFRSPLAGLNQLGEMLRDGRVADERKRQSYYELIVAETLRLRRLVENILDFSRVQDGRVPYRFETIEPASWLREVAKEAESSLNGAGVRMDTRIPDHLPAIVGDREALSTAVHNLLDNAVKYSGESNVIEFSAQVKGSHLAISVRDHGAGIKETDKPYIFEKFFRGSSDSIRRVKGAGLGLSLVKHIVTQHGGSVGFEGREGEGSVFTILLSTGE